MIGMVLVDDQTVIRAGFHILLEENDDIMAAGEASSDGEAVCVVRAIRPDVVCMDLQMSGGDGLTTTRQIVAEREGGTPVVLAVTTFDMNVDVFGALEVGADGFTLKGCEPEELVDTVRHLVSGHDLVNQSATRRVIVKFARRQGRVENRKALGVFTEREREVVQLLASDISSTEIAAELVVETSTIESHLTRILPKIDTRDRVQAVVWALRNELVRGVGRRRTRSA